MRYKTSTFGNGHRHLASGIKHQVFAEMDDAYIALLGDSVV
jgi:hypothetical protein